MAVPRDALASDTAIAHAWGQLPRQLAKIPPELRDERMVRMCVAVAAGLFDAALNYIWNAAILELREKVRRFGIAVVPQILDDESFDEESLIGLRDANLLTLCQQLNLIGDDDYFFLDQCRATRNNFSAAHPSNGPVDEDEFIGFMSRCAKHALSSVHNPKGVDTRALLRVIKTSRFTADQTTEWVTRIHGTFDAQRQLIFVMLHGIYCDPASAEQTRLNGLDVCRELNDTLSPKTKSALIDRHQDYKGKGDEARISASTQFFERIGQLALLGETEIHAVFTTASQKLLDVHHALDNFYNEPPFAERLYELSSSNAVPETAQTLFVEAVVTAAIGNGYGVSRAAIATYQNLVTAFSPREVSIMLELASQDTRIRRRLNSHTSCNNRYRDLVRLIEKTTIPSTVKALYESWIK